jgi:hypothetical protein
MAARGVLLDPGVEHGDDDARGRRLGDRQRLRRQRVAERAAVVNGPGGQDVVRADPGLPTVRRHAEPVDQPRDVDLRPQPEHHDQPAERRRGLDITVGPQLAQLIGDQIDVERVHEKLLRAVPVPRPFEDRGVARRWRRRRARRAGPVRRVDLLGMHDSP